MSILRRLSRFLGTDGEMTNVNPGKMAPGFSLKGLDGKEYSLPSLTQKGPVVAAFFKISCPVCQFTFPFLERLYKRYGGDGITFLGISQDDAKATKSFASEYGVTFPIALDEKGYPASNAYGLTNVPTIFLIDTHGAVKVTCVGFGKKEMETIAAELAERRKIAPAALFLPNESVPAHKPG
jgi:cytochrome c biogenesis protein CcmG/thiol:disulfide interchange protein DsbE